MGQNNFRFELEKKGISPSFLALLFLGSLPFLLQGCESAEKGSPYNLKVSKQEIFRFDLSPKTYQVRNLSMVREDGNTYLLNNNYSAYDTLNQLEIYDFKEQKLVDRIDLMPDTLPFFTQVLDILYLNKDSIFYSRPERSYQTAFVHMDRSGEIHNSWTFSGTDPEWERGKIRIGGTHHVPHLDQRKGILYSPVFPKRSELSGSVFGYANMVRVSLPKDDSVPKIEPFGKYPRIYPIADEMFLPDRSLQKVVPFPLFDHAMDKRSIVMSYPFVDTLYRYDLQGELLDKKVAKSRKVSPQQVWVTFKEKGIEKLREKYQKRLKGIPHYHTMVYDPYRELYYRTVNLSAERSALMILDEELRYIRELSFKKAHGGHLLPFTGPILPTQEAVYIPIEGEKGLRFRELKIRKKGAE